MLIIKNCLEQPMTLTLYSTKTSSLRGTATATHCKPTCALSARAPKTAGVQMRSH